MDGPRAFKKPDDLFHNKLTEISNLSLPIEQPDLVAHGYTVVHRTQNGLESLKEADQSKCKQKSHPYISKSSSGGKIESPISDQATNSPSLSSNGLHRPSLSTCSHTEKPIVLPSSRKASGSSVFALLRAFHVLISGHALTHKHALAH
jgi:hypothetical protein